MNRKLLSLILVFTLLFTTVYLAVPTAFAEGADNITGGNITDGNITDGNITNGNITDGNVPEEPEVIDDGNLIKNGKFQAYENNIPTNWAVNTTTNATVEVVEDVDIAEGVTANAVKFTTTADNPKERSNCLYYTGKVAINQNAKYTTTFWVKAKNIPGFRTYMYEPEYIDKDGNQASNPTAQEGQNIYSFSYLGKDASGNPTTRVCRTDVKHSWKVAETGTAIDNSTVSMFISRSNGVELPLTPDYPQTEHQGEWLQVIHTFETGASETHEAEISYQFTVPEAIDGELWIADVNMSVEYYYTPDVNDNTLGCTSTVIAKDGEEITVTATPLGEAVFAGWYNGNELVSKANDLTFTYDAANLPQYIAKFELPEGSIKIVEGFETGYTNNQVLAEMSDIDYHTDTSLWTEDLFKTTSKDGNNKFFIDSDWSKYGKAIVTNAQAHTGSFSIRMSPNSRSIGYKLEGLDKNTKYTISFYAMSQGTTDSTTSTVGSIAVTDANQSCIVKSSEGVLGQRTDVTGALVRTSGAGTDCRGSWKKYSVSFNTNDSTDVIVWVRPEGAGTQLYIDDFALARIVDVNVEFSRLGSTTKLPADITRNAALELVATPYEGNTFEGWYVGNDCVCKDAKYSFTAYDVTLTPKFSGENTPDFEYFSTFNQDGTFENGTINGFEFYDPTYTYGWCTTEPSTNFAYEGSKSLAVFARHRNTILPIKNLYKHTRYTLSFWFKINETEHEAADGSGVMKYAQLSTGGIVAPGVKHISAETETIAKTEPILSTGEWQKYEITFNSGDYESFDFVLRFACEGDIPMYIDNMQLVVGQEEDHLYSGDCDTTCAYCSDERVALAEHTLDKDCTDTDCNVCGVTTREAKEHTYDNACDTDCNNEDCDFTRNVDNHEYDNDCDANCNICEAPRTVGEHKYDNACDAACNICDEGREVPEHQYSNATCTAPKTCSVCGATEGTALGHKFANATCTKAKTCSVCGVTEGKALGHKFANATCTKAKTCSVCNETEGKALGHKFANATCTKAKTCSVCGVTEGKALGHKFANATCTKAKTCTVCKIAEGKALGHTYKNVVTKATLKANGKIVKKCNVCNNIASTTVISYPKTIKIAKTTYTYTGKVITPAITVKGANGKAIAKTNYTVTYAKGRKNVGTYKVTVTFKGNHSGTKAFNFTINPVKTTVNKLVAGKKSLKVTIGKKTNQVTGYEIQYATNKTFKSAKTKNVKSYKTTSVTLNKLTAKKTYYVRVRTFKTVGGKKYYSAWSAAKNKKTK